MATQKPLAELIPELMLYVTHQEQNVIENHKKLFEVYDRQLSKHLKEDIDEEITRAHVRVEMKKRMAPINLLPKIIDKISTIYDVSPSRTLENERSQELLGALTEKIDLDVELQHAAELVQLNGACGIEPFLDTRGVPSVRVLPLHQFTVWSDDPKNPKNPTVFIKFMGEKWKEFQRADSEGDANKDADQEMERVALYHIYTDTEFLIVDSSGSVDKEEMEKHGADGTNPLGFIPLVYINSSKTSLVPLPDNDKYQLSKVFPLMFTDLNHATKYQSHGIVAVFGAEEANRPAGPGDIWYIQPSESSDGEAANPSIEVVQPNVDSEKAVALIVEQVTLWLDSMGVKTGAVGKISANNAASGIAKIIDEADASQAVSKLKSLFNKVEHNIFDMLRVLHNSFWSNIDGYVIQSGRFSEDDELALEFGIQQTIESSKAITDEQILLLEHKLTSRRKALKAIHPNLDEVEIEQLIVEIDKETQEQVAKAQEFMANNSNQEDENAQGNSDGVEQSQMDDSTNGSDASEQ